jgi:hypothetical protein
VILLILIICHFAGVDLTMSGMLASLSVILTVGAGKPKATPPTSQQIAEIRADLIAKRSDPKPFQSGEG